MSGVKPPRRKPPPRGTHTRQYTNPNKPIPPPSTTTLANDVTHSPFTSPQIPNMNNIQGAPNLDLGRPITVDNDTNRILKTNKKQSGAQLQRQLSSPIINSNYKKPKPPKRSQSPPYNNTENNGISNLDSNINTKSVRFENTSDSSNTNITKSIPQLNLPSNTNTISNSNMKPQIPSYLVESGNNQFVLRYSVIKALPEKLRVRFENPTSNLDTNANNDEKEKENTNKNISKPPPKNQTKPRPKPPKRLNNRFATKYDKRKVLIKGSCHCKNTLYELLSFPEDIQHCYCNMCRKMHGSPVASWCPINELDIRWIKRKNITSYQSSNGVTREFCSKCGSNISLKYSFQTDTLWLTPALFDDQINEINELQSDLNLSNNNDIDINIDERDASSSLISLKSLHADSASNWCDVARVLHIFCSSKCKWYELPNDGNPKLSSNDVVLLPDDIENIYGYNQNDIDNENNDNKNNTIGSPAKNLSGHYMPPKPKSKKNLFS